jgi:mersacidin/lichenicidin family type 2 lantibiotic
MTPQKIVRSWKDPVYRSTLTDVERASLPAHPAGSLELSDDDLRQAAGGILTYFCTRLCTRFSCGYCTATYPGFTC